MPYSDNCVINVTVWWGWWRRECGWSGLV